MKPLFVIVAVLALGSIACAEPAPRLVPSPQDIAEAVANLDHPQYRQRLQAARKLVSAGKIAIAPLAKAAKTGSVEASDRALKILNELAFEAGDDETALAALDSLLEIADSRTRAATDVRSLLGAYFGDLVAHFESAGAFMHRPDNEVVVIHLDNVADPQRLLPLLPKFPHLRALSIANKTFGAEQMKRLPPLPNLKSLYLSETAVTDDSLAVLRRCPKLNMLYLGKTSITDAGLAHLSKLKHLETLVIDNTAVSDAGLVHLQEIAGLMLLDLTRTRVTDRGLSNLHSMNNLCVLRLNHTKVSDSGLANLKRLPALTVIEISGTEMSEAGVKRWKEDQARSDR